MSKYQCFQFKPNDDESKDDDDDENDKKKKKPKVSKFDKFANLINKQMKAYKKNFYYLSEDTLVIFGPPIDQDEIVGIYDE